MWPGQVVRALRMAQAAAWASCTVSVLAQVKRASKMSCHQLAECRRSAGERRHVVKRNSIWDPHDHNLSEELSFAALSALH